MSTPSTNTTKLSLFVPAVVPSVQLVSAAIPLASVVTGLPTTLPSPDGTDTTLSPATGLPSESVTNTEGGVATAVPTVAA